MYGDHLCCLHGKIYIGYKGGGNMGGEIKMSLEVIYKQRVLEFSMSMVDYEIISWVAAVYKFELIKSQDDCMVSLNFPNSYVRKSFNLILN